MQKKQILNRIIFAWLFVASVLVAACAKETAPPVKAKTKTHLVEIAEVVVKEIGVERTRNGTLRAQREVKIFNQEEGRIASLPYFEGDPIKKGDVLVRLDDRVLQAQLSRARATRKQAELDLRRIQDLFKKKLVSDEQLNRAETGVEVARADEEVLVARLGYTTIASPLEGYVSERLSEPGNIAESYTHLLTVADPASLVTEVTVSELLINQLSVNDAVNVQIDALGAQIISGRISRIHPTLDPVTRRGTVEVELKPVPKGTRPGQLCRVQFRTRASARIMLPFRALRRDDAGEFVYIVDAENKVERAEIHSGLRIGEQVEIITGLVAGQRIVSKGFLGLTPGKTVSVVKSEPVSNALGDT